MDQRAKNPYNVDVRFNFVRRQSETSLHCLNQDQNANFKHNTGAGINRSITFTPRDVSRVSTVKARITLPERFRRKIYRKDSNSRISSGSFANGLENIDEEIDYDKNLDWEDRKSDMERAIEWVKQELLNIREQDRVLVKRFLDLQTAIQQTHVIRSCPSLASRSNTSLSSSSWLSLDDGSLSAPGDTPVHQRDILLDLQQRAHSNYTQLMMRQSSADVSTKNRDVDDFHLRTVSLMNVSLTHADSLDRVHYSYDSLKKYEDVLTESDDESNYDTLTKYPAKDRQYDENSDSLNNSEIEEIFSDDDSHYDTLKKYPQNDSASEDDSSYDTLTKHPRKDAANGSKEEILTCTSDKENDFDTDSLEQFPTGDEPMGEEQSFDTHL